MKAFFKNAFQKQWPFFLHLAAGAVVCLDPAVQVWATAHPLYGFAIVAAWGKLLHWAQSPLSK